MTTSQKRRVLLVGGPFDGETREVSEYAYLFTEPVSYRRRDDGTFVHCRTPTAANDRDLELPEQQLALEEP